MILLQLKILLHDYELKPNIVATGSKDLTTLFSIKIGTTFNFRFLNFQKAIWFPVRDQGIRIEL